jgi:3-hydroxybutyryl-CoA dehydrogenase
MLKKVAIIGSGTMGQGIAQWFIEQDSTEVYLVDQSEIFTEKARDQILKNWDRLIEKKKITTDQKNQYEKKLKLAHVSTIPSDIDLAVEAIIENLEIKQQLFLELDNKLGGDAIFATNTSSFSVAAIAKNLSNKRKNNFLGLHFFNPATLMKLVEVVVGPETTHELAENLATYFKSHQKNPVICKDSPGFIVNRIARNYYGESLQVLKNFDSEKIKEIDLIMKEVGGFKMGPFELMDLIGIDINLSVTESVWQQFYQTPRFTPHPIQKQLVNAGRFGKKTKKGFYSYE